MTAKTLLAQMEPLGRESYRSVLRRHGAHEPCYGVKIEEMKKLVKGIKQDHRLALDLYDSGVYDAMYLAGLLADDAKMTKLDLQRWVEKASRPLATSTVAWVAAGSPSGWEIAQVWIDSKEERVAAAGWSTLGSLVSIKADAELDLPALKRLMQRVGKTIQAQPGEVRSQMNGFLIAVGCYVLPLTALAKEIGEKIGEVTVEREGTACQVPRVPAYIEKVEKRGSLGKKRKTAKC